MLHAGVDETHLNDILTSVDVPAVCHKTVKKVERQVGMGIESCAACSCEASLRLECQLTQEKASSRQEGIVSTVTQPTGTATTNHSSTSTSSALKISPSSGVSSSTTCNRADQLSPEKRTLYEQRMLEGYDLPDPEYEQWKASRSSCADAGCMVLPTPPDGKENAVGITVAYDMGWAKRGRAMNSLCGVGANIGQETGKVVAYTTRNKHCATCNAAERCNRPAKPHNCRRNHFDSSKPMEPAAVHKTSHSTVRRSRAWLVMMTQPPSGG